MKFKFSQKLLDSCFDFPNSIEAERSPLAAKIFGFPWTSHIYLGEDFIAVTKQDWVEWEVLAEPLAGIIRDHIDQGLGLYVDFDTSTSDENNDVEDTPIVKKIKSIIQREIRPIVSLDGGDVVFAKYENNILYLHMRGACAGCPSKSVTLKQGIEVRIKEVLPEIQEVRAT